MKLKQFNRDAQSSIDPNQKFDNLLMAFDATSLYPSAMYDKIQYLS